MSVTRVDAAPLITADEFPPLKHFIGGVFVAPAGDAFSEVVNPATGEAIAQVPRGTVEEVNIAVDAAYEASAQWGTTTPKERAEAML